MKLIYNIIISTTYFFLKKFSLVSKKLKLFTEGRKKSFHILSGIKTTDKVFWFHAASLGEFEQARPIIETIRDTYFDYKIVVTFFSPSGYEIRKNYPYADFVCYLPFDTESNMRKFVSLIHPTFAFIIKYEFWPNLLDQLERKKIKTILISGIFRKEQLFFKWYGKYMRKKLNTFDYFFVQNSTSLSLLKSINFTNATRSGDTRFDRVNDILKQNNQIPSIEEFIDNKHTIVAGSTWPEDEKFIVDYINNHLLNNEKVIIVPHNIHENKIHELKASITKNVVLLSQQKLVNFKTCQVLIIDTIGLLTKIYSYADIAYVGGGLATGLHNILEPAIFGIPIIFGGIKYKKFQEAIDLLNLGGVTIVTNKKELIHNFVALRTNHELRQKMGAINFNYVTKNTGATKTILEYIKNNLC